MPDQAITRTDDLASRLADEITNGLLPPGVRLDEQSLAHRFQVSRTPVREALRQLEATGLVARRPYCGAVVCSVTPGRLADMFTAMGEMEAICARLAALAMEPQARCRLRGLHDAMGAAMRRGDVPLYQADNLAFHEMIYAGAHNALLAEMTRDLRRRLMPFRRAQFHTAGRLGRSHAEHERVVLAIERGQADEAAAAMRRHVSSVEAAFHDFALHVGHDAGARSW